MSELSSQTREMFGNRECVCLEAESNDFEAARTVATNKAKEIYPGAELLYWYDRDSSMCSPGTVCTGPKIPDWLKDAGKLCDTIPVGVNEGAYFFAFAGSNCRNSSLA